jgi:hypothetical protein
LVNLSNNPMVDRSSTLTVQQNEHVHIDASVYPDVTPPSAFSNDYERADYVQRICAAWDFGIVPDDQTFELFQGWRSVFDEFPLIHSPAYATFRAWFGWPHVAGSVLRADYERLDRAEGRTDPCAMMF